MGVRRIGEITGLLAAALLLASLLLPAPARSEEEAGWEKLYVKEGISGFRRITPGSNFAAWRGHGVVKGNFYRVVAVYMDSERSCDWLADCVDNHFVEKKDLEHQITYNQTHLPWPFQNRDLVFSDTYVFDLEKKEVTDIMRSVVHPKEPERDGVVRAKFLLSTFKARVIDAENTWVEVELQMDTGGWLPAWIVNLTSKNWPFDTFVRLRQAVATAGGYEPLIEQIREAHPGYDEAPSKPDPQ
ncbi:MAG: START domain-containing protein [Deltaproteobacteria bacterium]|nr:START domain-containing protein [Deltaproteobacteria bacterium]